MIKAAVSCTAHKAKVHVTDHGEATLHHQNIPLVVLKERRVNYPMFHVLKELLIKISCIPFMLFKICQIYVYLTGNIGTP